MKVWSWSQIKRNDIRLSARTNLYGFAVKRTLAVLHYMRWIEIAAQRFISTSRSKQVKVMFKETPVSHGNLGKASPTSVNCLTDRVAV